MDFDVGLAHVDREVGAFVADLLVQAMNIDDEDRSEIIRNVMTLMLWMFLIGREHADRGYRRPVPQPDGEISGRDILRDRFRLHEARAKAEPGWLNPAVDASGEPRSGFGAEFHEIADDVVVDYRRTMLDLDPEVGRRVNDFVIQLIWLAGPDTERVLMNLLSGALWMFRLGREHAARGYGSPVPRDDGESWIPDTLAEIFDSGD